VNKMKATSFIK